ncbi:MAG: Ldh family oxidoreductase [Thaumarchaeota archaeon]|nr:Ldh family oxidoreductase [Nitrososphaerota archaeon]
MDPLPKVSSEKLDLFLRQAFLKVGLTGPQTDTVVDLLITTSLRGVDTHGIVLAERYIEGVVSGEINKRPRPRVLRSTRSAAVIDGDKAPGAFVATQATRLAISKARKTGIGAVSLVNLTHCGALSYYGMMVAKEKMAAMSYTNSSRFAAPWGGASRVFGTNPLCFAFPNGKENIVFDIATTTGAGQKVVAAVRDGKTIPAGWALDRDGKPTTDPARAMDGILLPFGGHKGYGLMFTSEFYSALLGGGVLSLAGEGRYFQGGFYIQATDIGAFRDYSGYLRDMKRLVRKIRSSKLAEGFEKVYLPGEPELNTRARRSREGIPVDAETWAYFETVSKRLGIPLPTPNR